MNSRTLFDRVLAYLALLALAVWALWMDELGNGMDSCNGCMYGSEW